MNLTFKEIKPSNKDMKDMFLNKHYLLRVPPIKYAFGVYEGETLLGAVSYGSIQFKTILQSISSMSTYDNTLELNRLYIEEFAREKYENLASQLVGYSLRQLKKLNKIIVSFADTGTGNIETYAHVGYIYQACNFYFCGVSKGSLKAYNGYGRRGGHWVKGTKYRFVIYPNSKNRYVYIAGDKRFKKKVYKSLTHKPEDYPKDYERTYEVGKPAIDDRVIYDRDTGDKYLESNFIHTKLYKEYFIDTDMYI